MGWVGGLVGLGWWVSWVVADWSHEILDFQEATSRLFYSIHFGEIFGHMLKNPTDIHLQDASEIRGADL